MAVPLFLLLLAALVAIGALVYGLVLVRRELIYRATVARRLRDLV